MLCCFDGDRKQRYPASGYAGSNKKMTYVLSLVSGSGFTSSRRAWSKLLRLRFYTFALQVII